VDALEWWKFAEARQEVCAVAVRPPERIMEVEWTRTFHEK